MPARGGPGRIFGSEKVPPTEKLGMRPTVCFTTPPKTDEIAPMGLLAPADELAASMALPSYFSVWSNPKLPRMSTVPAEESM